MDRLFDAFLIALCLVALVCAIPFVYGMVQGAREVWTAFRADVKRRNLDKWR